MASFEITGDTFALDGQPFRVLSGTIHYFRVPREYWVDRIHKARLMGLNTIETYVPWNLHEPDPGAWEATGRLDLAAFLQAIADEGMHAIVRPGPYICAELDGGGLPGWLFKDSPPVAHEDNRVAAG
ncbi:MAG: beta-galactosidase, partial [Ancrocorticia sp.]